MGSRVSLLIQMKQILHRTGVRWKYAKRRADVDLPADITQIISYCIHTYIFVLTI